LLLLGERPKLQTERDVLTASTSKVERSLLDTVCIGGELLSEVLPVLGVEDKALRVLHRV
jgi:hypothetical protein